MKHIRMVAGNDKSIYRAAFGEERLSEVLRKGDTVARFGGDEFMLILTDLKGEDDAGQYSRASRNLNHESAILQIR